ncbi:MAG: nuclear transport factor 2 family protein [Mycobacterium sp.]
MTLAVGDRLELGDLVHRYAAYVDARRFDDVARLFTPTAELTVPKPPDSLAASARYDGPAGVRTAMAGLTDVIRTHHAIVGEVYTGSGADGTATGIITGVARHWTERDGRVTDLVWYLHYADEYRHTETGWRIARRALTIDAIETQPALRVRR